MEMEQEEKMWKSIYSNLQKQLSVDVEDHTEHQKRIQQVDDGFFERFGSLFRDYSESMAEKERQEREKTAREAKRAEETEVVQKTATESDADGESVATSSDSEVEEPDPSDFIGCGLNIEELYSQVLYEILHNVGCDVNYEIGQTALLSYVQEAFKMANLKHQELLQAAESKEAPEILLNVEIIEAKDLVPKDSNGLSDPFVTLYLASNAAHRYNTSVKSKTLNPVWEEHFALPISDQTSDDTLCVEVWDFDPAESVKEKLGKIFGVKGVRGIRKLVKEIAVTAATGQHENEFVGKAKIPLKGIPASGMTMWYSLDKKHKVNRQGVIKVRLTFGSEKNSQVAAQEYRHLLRILLLHELEMSKVAPYWWNGTFSIQAETLLTQHIAQSSLCPSDVALSQWIVYSSVHVNQPLSFALFSTLLDKLQKPLESSNFCEEDLKLFWDATKKILPTCYNVVRKIRKKSTNENVARKQLQDILSILKKLSGLEVPENVDMFPKKSYGWLAESSNQDRTVLSVLREAVVQGAKDWFNHILENNARNDDTDCGKLQYLMKIVQLIRTDLQKAIEVYERIFRDTVKIPYSKCIYLFYDEKLAALAEEDVTTICKSLKRLSFAWKTSNQEDSSEPLSEGQALFELYLTIQRFFILSNELCPTELENLHLKNFHRWFHGGVAQWLDIAVYKALQRIEKAVDLDSLIPVDATVKYTSSAVDTLTIFYQVKIFWEQLNWPDVEGSYTFMAKIIDDICRCCVFYADKMSKKVDGMGDINDMYEKRFEVTKEWCLAINNIEYVRQSLKPFTEELGMEQIIEKLSDLRSAPEAQRCELTLNNVIANAIDTVKNKIIELLEVVANKMAPAMRRLLVEGAELLHQDSNSIHRLMLYVDSNLSTLHEHLNEENFNRILSIVWDTLNYILGDLLQSNLDKRRPPSFFANLHETLNLMVKSFKRSEERAECDGLGRTEHLLKINGLETSDLIHEVHLDLWKKQQENSDNPELGELTVKVQFEKNSLKIEVMNARNLPAMDSNGSCDSFVRIHLLPEEQFVGINKPKTQTHNKCQFPLYDEKFVLNLSENQRNLKNGLILFSVKDKDFLGYNNQYIGEAFIHFKDIPDTSTGSNNLPQVHLSLRRPTDLTSDAIKALEHRLGDKQAKEFLRKYKQKMGTIQSN